MSISKRESYKQAFLISERDLKKFDSSFQELPGEIKYSVETEDGFERDYDTLEEVLSLENSSSNPIKELTLSSISYNPFSRAMLSFKKGNYNNIYLDLQTENEKAPLIFKSIEDKIEGTKPWFSFLAKADFINYTIGGFVILSILLWILIAFDYFQSNSNEADPQTDALGKIVAILIIGGFFFIGWLFNKVRDRVFPSGTFAIGQGLKRNSTLENVRWVVFVGGLISFTIGLILLAF